MGFRFPAYRTLQRNLGLADAAAEANEVALRCLVTATRDPARNELLSLNHLAIATGVRVSDISAKKLLCNMHQLYLMNVHSFLEVFADDLRHQHPQGGSWNKTKEQNDWDMLLAAVGDGSSRVGIRESIPFKVVGYYTRVRNKFAHERGKKEDKLEEEARSLNESLTKSGDGAVSNYNEIGFDDFLFYTRMGKELAEKFCIHLKPDIPGLAKSVELLSKDPNSTVDLQSLKKLTNDPVRLKRAVVSLCRELFGDDAHLAGLIYDDLRKGPLA